jgi:hypothetical protein
MKTSRRFATRAVPRPALGLLAVLAALLSACAGYAPPSDLSPGTSQTSVIAAMGPPALRLPLPDGSGTRLVFARGPMGAHTWMIDVDRAGQVRHWHQALGEEQFARIRPGLSADDLLFALGPPAERRRMGWTPTEVWSYRFADAQCRWFRIELDRRQVVIASDYAEDPLCRRPFWDW